MSDNPNDYPWVLIILSMISGLVGGCGAASYQLLKGRELSAAIFAAYCLLGVFLGAVSFFIIFIVKMMGASIDTNTTLIISSMMGFAGPVAVMLLRGIITIALAFKGIKFSVKIDRDD